MFEVLQVVLICALPAYLCFMLGGKLQKGCISIILAISILYGSLEAPDARRPVQRNGQQLRRNSRRRRRENDGSDDSLNGEWAICVGNYPVQSFGVRMPSIVGGVRG